MTTPDNAAVATSYSGNTVTMTDQAGRQRRNVTDALGRLVQVYEAPNNPSYNYLTSYVYDALDNLLTVNQGSQTRTFIYDSLKRLISTTNPESGTQTYQYDASGNLTQKVDARGIVSTYADDALDRNTSISYSDSTPAVMRYYDGAINGKGRLWLSYAGPSHTAVDAYDATGRPTVQRQHFFANGNWGAAYTTQRAYNLAGSVTSQTYPSGRVVNYAYDQAGRTASFTGSLGDGVTRTYADSITYDQWNGLARERFGTSTSLYHKEHRNIRGQLYDVRLSTINDDLNWNRGAVVNYYSFQPYGFGTSGPDNNGNLLVQQHWVPNDDAISSYSFMQQNYDYDPLNRLIWMAEYQNGASATGSQSYAYDRYGNRTLSGWGTGINNQQFAINPDTNQFGVPAGQSGAMQYDAAGNLTNDTYSGHGARTYDALNHMVAAINSSSQQSIYTYDADGDRVRRSSYGQETWQVYGLEGELLAEYAAGASPASPQKEYGYRSGQLLVITQSATTSAVTDFSSTQNPNGVWRYGYKALSGSTFNSYSSNANLFGAGLDSWSQGYCCPMITRNATGTTYTYPGAPSVTQPADVLNLHPGPNGERSVVRWTAPDAGTYTITGRFQGIDSVGTTTDVTILHNTTSVFTANINGYGNQATFSLTRTVAAGDTIDFQVGYGSNNSYGCDSTGLAVTVTPQGGVTNLQWLVADQLGTPRMIADKTGSLAGISRHDYLPFGEELLAGTGNRTNQQGYQNSDGVRQKLTQKERDVETGLDYFLARYYASVQGRFTSPDPLYYTAARPGDPQQFNLYGYVRNNPLNLTDPDGKKIKGASFRAGNIVDLTEEDRQRLEKDLRRLSPGTRVDAQGNIHKPGLFRRMINHLTGHGKGTSLVSKLADSQKTVAIVVAPNSSASATNDQVKFTVGGEVPDVAVFWGAKSGGTSPVLTLDGNGNKTIQDQENDSAIGLGHELIHVDHKLRGTYREDDWVHNFTEGNIRHQETYRYDEFRTVGFKGYTEPGDITENQLRKELGKPPRAAYLPRKRWITKI